MGLVALYYRLHVLIFFHLAALNPKSTKYDKKAVWGAFMGGIIARISDEALQVTGIRALGDLTSFTMAHQSFWSMEEMKKTSSIWNVSMKNYLGIVCST